MGNLEKLKQAFSRGLRIEAAGVTEELRYGSKGWDSVGHMSLVAAIENTFNVRIDIGDVVDIRSFAKAMEILPKYGVNF